MEEVTCDLQYSGAAEAFLALAVGGTLAIVVLAPFPDEARALLFAWVVGAATHARGKLRRVRWLRIDAGGAIEVREADRTRAGRVLRGSFVAPWLMIVNWRPADARLRATLVILPGMVGAETLREIRVLLRWA